MSAIDRRDEALLAEAWQLPVAALYRRSAPVTQRLRAMCGPTSAVNVLRSLGVAADQSTILDGTGVASLFGLRAGVTLGQMRRLLEHQIRLPIAELRDLDLASLRAELAQVNDPTRRYIANFDRNLLFGWGGGHHSPLGGYLASVDRALVLDVNARVGAWLVSTEELHAAISTVDPSSGQRRGLLRVG